MYTVAIGRRVRGGVKWTVRAVGLDLPAAEDLTVRLRAEQGTPLVGVFERGQMPETVGWAVIRRAR